METTTVSLGVTATPQQIEVAFPQPVSDVKVMAPYGKLANRNLEGLGWQRKQVDERTHVFRPDEDAKLRLKAGDEHRLTVEYSLEGEPQRESEAFEVQADAAESYEPDEAERVVFEERSEAESLDELVAEDRQYGPWPPDFADIDDEIQAPAFPLMEEDIYAQPDCVAPVEVSITERPSILLKLPVTIAKGQPMVCTVPDPASLEIQSQGWTLCSVADRVIECIPPDDVASELEGMKLSVRFTCGLNQYEQVVEAKPPESRPGSERPEYPTGSQGPVASVGGGGGPSTGGGGGGTGGGGGGAGGGGGGTTIRGGRATGPWAGSPGQWPPPGQPNPWDVLAVPVQVASSGSNPGQGTPGGSLSGGSLGDQVSGLFRRQMPGLAFRPTAAQFRESLNRLAPASGNGGFWASPYAGGSLGASPQSGAAGASAVATAAAPATTTSPAATAFGPIAAPVTASPQITPSQLSGAFGPLVSIADVLERQALTAASAVQPIGAQADPDLVESHRGEVERLLTQLIAEFRRDDWEGPRRPVALNEIARLQSHMASFGRALEILPGAGGGPPATPVTTQDHANIALFNVLVQLVTIADVTAQGWNPAGGDPRPRMGELKTYLKTIAELADRLRAQLEQFGLAPQRLSATLTVGGALNWIQDETGQQLQQALDTAGPPTGPDIQTALGNQFVVVRQMGRLPNFPWNHPMVARLVIDLDQYIRTAYQLAGAL